MYARVVHVRVLCLYTDGCGYPDAAAAAAAAAKSLQSCPTLCNPIDGTPLQYSCLENPRDGGAWWAAVYGVAQSRTRLK